MGGVPGGCKRRTSGGAGTYFMQCCSAAVTMHVTSLVRIEVSHQVWLCLSSKGHAAGWVARGNAQRQLTQPLAALESYQTATEVGPRHVAGWHNMGVVLHELGRVAASDAALGRARELKNQRP